MKAMAFLLTKQRLYAKIYQAFYQLHTLAAAYLTILGQSEPACVSAARGNKADVCRLTKKNKTFFLIFVTALHSGLNVIYESTISGKFFQNIRRITMTAKEYCTLYKRSRDKAYDALFESYCDYVYAIVYNKLRSIASREDMEECVSDIFADVFFGYDTDSSFDGDLKGYVGTVAKRRAINAFHSLTARSGHYSDSAEEELVNIGSETDIEADSDNAETRSILMSMIKELGEPDSTIILQKYYYDRSSSEIAEQLSMKASAVRMRAARALNKLKITLAAAGITL